jgi:hypothetical protein
VVVVDTSAGMTMGMLQNVKNSLEHLQQSH